MPTDTSTHTARRPDIILKERFSGAARAAFGLIGAALIVLPAYDLRHAFLSFGWWTLFFGVIVAGAIGIGGALLVGAVLGETGVWRLGRDRLDIALRSPLRKRRLKLRADDIRAVAVMRRPSDDGPDSFAVELLLAAAFRPITSPAFADLAAADHFVAELRARLGIPPKDATQPRDAAP